MKKKYLLIVLLLFLFKSYAQEPLQHSYVSKTYLNSDDGWNEVNFSKMINISSNSKGRLMVTNAEFLRDLSNGKAKMLEDSAYNSAEFTTAELKKTKTEKNGVVNATYDGKLEYKCIEGNYSANATITFLIFNADIVGLKIINKESQKEYAFDLTIKD